MDLFIKIVLTIIAVALSTIAWKMTDPATQALAQGNGAAGVRMDGCGTMQNPCIVAEINGCGYSADHPCIVSTSRNKPVQVFTDGPLEIVGEVRTR